MIWQLMVLVFLMEVEIPSLLLIMIGFYMGFNMSFNLGYLDQYKLFFLSHGKPRSYNISNSKLPQTQNLALGY